MVTATRDGVSMVMLLDRIFLPATPLQLQVIRTFGSIEHF